MCFVLVLLMRKPTNFHCKSGFFGPTLSWWRRSRMTGGVKMEVDLRSEFVFPDWWAKIKLSLRQR